MSLSCLNPLVMTQTWKIIDEHLECDRVLQKLPLPFSLPQLFVPQNKTPVQLDDSSSSQRARSSISKPLELFL